MAEYKEIVKVGDHIYKRPPLPSKDKILFIDDKKSDAFWRRDTNYPDIWFDFIPYKTQIDADATKYDNNTNELIALNTEDTETIRRLYRQEVDRRTNGVYFKNGDNIEYLTGNNYHTLQWCPMATIDGAPYASYREFQRDFFYIIDIAQKSRNISGAAISKPKKTGISNLMWNIALNEATLIRDRNFGAMNIDKNKSADTFRDYFVYSLNRMPSPLIPETKSFAERDGYVTFGAKYSGSKKQRGKRDIEDLNSAVICLPTDPHAADIKKFHIVWIDEYPKLKESIEEIFTVTSQAVMMGNYKNGIIVLTSYTPDEDTRSFKEARKIFFDAELSTITDLERNKTKNGLINWHIPATASWIGENNDCFDKYGQCNELKALQEIEYQRTKVKDDTRALQAITRQYAITKKEAWASAGAGSTFDNIRLGDIQSSIQEEARNTTHNLYVDGKLEWEVTAWEVGRKNKRPMGEFAPVKFVPTSEREKKNGEKGRLQIYDYVPQKDQNAALRNRRDEWNNLMPPSLFLYVGGVDPTDYAASGEVLRGSKNAGHTFVLPDEARDSSEGRIVSNKLISQYFYRPENPSEFYEDVVKEIIFFNKLVMPEGNKKWLSTKLIEDGLGRYMLVRNKENGIITTWKPGMDYTFVQTTAAQGNKEMLEWFVRLIKTFIEYPAEGEKDLGATIKSEELLQQLMDFDPNETKFYDLVMSFGYTLAAKESYMNLLLAANNNSKDDYRTILTSLTKAHLYKGTNAH